jgi:hypothetical protein
MRQDGFHLAIVKDQLPPAPGTFTGDAERFKVPAKVGAPAMCE